MRSVLRAQWRLRRATSVPRTVRLTGHPFVVNDGTMVLHDRVQLQSHVSKLELSVGPGGRLEIGERTFVNYGTSISVSESVRVGARCQIGTFCIILDNSFHHLEPERRDERPPSEPVVIGDDVWLGARVTVLPGVTIGSGSVVGAGSVVTRDVPPRTLVAGVPAKVVREL